MTNCANIIGLGPFLKKLEHRLDQLSKDELVQILTRHGKTLGSSGRIEFLAMLDSIPEEPAPRRSADNDRTLMQDIRDFVENLESGHYYESIDFDPEIHDYRSYGDESWAEEMDDLFVRADSVFLGGDYKTAAEAYGLLLHAFDLDDDGHFCGETCPTEMVGADVTEAKARYLRAVYETTAPDQRPEGIFNELYALRYSGDDMGLRAIAEAGAPPIDDLKAFMPAWIELLESKDHEDTDLIMLQAAQRLLREAVLMKDGVDGLARLAVEKGAHHPDIFRDWLDELLKQERKDEARKAARLAVDTVKDPNARAGFAERWVKLVENDGDRLEAARIAWRSEPDLSRLLRLNSVNRARIEEAMSRMADELDYWRTQKEGLDERLMSALLILAGRYDEAVKLMTNANPLGWSDYEHPCAVTYPFVLLAVAGEQKLPATSALSIWQRELSASILFEDTCHDTDATCGDADSNAGLWPAMRSVLAQNPITDSQRSSFLTAAKQTMLARVKAIANAHHRGAYNRAARTLAGWIEAAKLCNRAREADEVLTQIRDSYSRLSSLKREIAVFLGAQVKKHA